MATPTKKRNWEEWEEEEGKKKIPKFCCTESDETEEIEVNCYMLELTLKSEFRHMRAGIPPEPIFAMHSLNPGYYERGEEVLQKCNKTECVYPETYPELPNYEDYETFWPDLSENEDRKHPDDWWFYQEHKHGSCALFEGDFKQKALELGKSRILQIEDLMRNSKYGVSGTYNCKEYRDFLEKGLGVRPRMVYGWHGTLDRKKLHLSQIRLLYDSDLTPIDFIREQKSLGKLEECYFKLNIPDLRDSDVHGAAKE